MVLEKRDKKYKSYIIIIYTQNSQHISLDNKQKMKLSRVVFKTYTEKAL